MNFGEDVEVTMSPRPTDRLPSPTNNKTGNRHRKQQLGSQWHHELTDNEQRPFPKMLWLDNSTSACKPADDLLRPPHQPPTNNTRGNQSWMRKQGSGLHHEPLAMSKVQFPKALWSNDSTQRKLRLRSTDRRLGPLTCSITTNQQQQNGESIREVKWGQ